MPTLSSTKSKADCNTVNPFKDDLKLSCIQWIKIIVMTFTLAPIKCFMLGFTAILMWMLSCIGLCCIDSNQVCRIKFVGCRKCIQACVYCLTRVLFFCVGIYCVKIKGIREIAAKAPVMVCAPHSTMYDVMVASLLWASPVSKMAFKTVPVIGRVLTFLQTIYVDRDDPKQCQDARALIETRTEKSANELGWRRIFIFPEGTTTNAKALIPFKCGAFSASYPVLPVLLRITGEPDVYRWTWDRPYGDFFSIWLVLCQLYVRMQVEFLPPYVPNKDEVADPVLYANNVRKLMAKELRIPLSDLTYQDAKKLRKNFSGRSRGKSKDKLRGRSIRKISIKTSDISSGSSLYEVAGSGYKECIL